MSRTITRHLLGQSPLTLLSKDISHLKLSSKTPRPFSSSTSHRATDDESGRPRPLPFPRFRDAAKQNMPQRSSSLNPRAAAGGSGGAKELSGLFNDMVGHNQSDRSRQQRTLLDTNRSSDGTWDGSLLGKQDPHQVSTWQLHINSHRHNVHITVVRPPNWQHPETGVRYGVNGERTIALSLSAGNLGFRHSGRKHYDSAFQLASYVFTRMQESGISGWIRELEVSLRGFGAGREAVSKALMGTEGKALRGKVVKVSDATRLKFGGTRSPKPRRLG